MRQLSLQQWRVLAEVRIRVHQDGALPSPATIAGATGWPLKRVSAVLETLARRGLVVRYAAWRPQRGEVPPTPRYRYAPAVTSTA